MLERSIRQEFRDERARQGEYYHQFSNGLHSHSDGLIQASLYIPAVGKVTILMLLRNLYGWNVFATVPVRS
jgi:hypothetical protein